MPNTVQVFDDHGDLVGTYATIQAAVDASSAGWTVTASAGTYDEHVILNSDVTLQGANAGLDVADNARGPETIITGGVELSADGVTMDGVTISGSFDSTAFPSIGFQGRAGLVIQGADATIENSVFTGDATASRAFVTTTPSLTPSDFPTGLTFTHNLVQGWNQAASLILGSDGSITHNTFSGNLAGSIAEGEFSAFHVSDNGFSGSFAADVGGTTTASVDLSDFVHDNTYSAVAQPIHVELSGPDGQVVTGTDTATEFDVGSHVGAAEIHGGANSDTISYLNTVQPVTIDLGAGTSHSSVGSTTFTSIENASGSSAGDSLTGDGGDNILSGLAGDDVLTGGDGNDSLDGGAGNDTVSYEHAESGVTIDLALTTMQYVAFDGRDTLTSIEGVIGSSSNDMLTGTAGDNVLSGLGGDDTLNGGAGNDILDGGNSTGDAASYLGAAAGVTVSLAIAGAQNTVGAGTDTLIGIESLTGSAFNDTLTGNAGNNLLDGDAGNDTLSGGAGIDALYGGAGNNTLVGGAGDDFLAGGTGGGSNTLMGGAGNDNLIGGFGGSDTASYADAISAVTVNLAEAPSLVQKTGGAGNDTLFDIENLTGSNFNDTLTGDSGANILNGGAGNDNLSGGDGNDSLIGGTGSNSLSGGAGNDSLIGGAGSDSLSAGAGNDSLLGGLGNDTLLGGVGNDSIDGGIGGSDTVSYYDAMATGPLPDGYWTGVKVSLAITTAQNTIGSGIDTLTNIENLTGSGFNDVLTGNSAANILDGGYENDILNGGAGNDSLIGGYGNDTLIGGAGNDSLNGGNTVTGDTASYADATAGVTVSLAIAAAQNTIGDGVDTLTSIENLAGSNFNDTLTGSAVANVLSGGAGNDKLNGAAGNDSVFGGAGNDTLTGSVGNDILNGGAGNDHMDGGAAGSDTASYGDAAAAVTVNLALATAQNTGGSGTDTLLNFENLTGSNFNDKLSGSAAANGLSGLGGNDTLNGAAGNDSLSGGAGNDRLIGGAGNDSLDGGVGVDSFVFDKGFGKDTITGFVASGAAHDKIDFSTATFANFAAVHSHMAQSGANVIITLDSADTITIKNVTVASLTAADFAFHPGTAPAAPPQAAAAAWMAHSAEVNSHLHLG